MLTYIGDGPYCYANSASMLLESAGESFTPRLIEALSGVGLGAFWVAESQAFYLSGWASAPDVGVSRSFRLLGFDVAEDAALDGDPMPVEALDRQLAEGPVMLGPLDTGELPYYPHGRGATGVDHFVLALHKEDNVVVVHDPAGYPAVPIDAEALGRAWRADLITYRRGRYRRWHSPVRVANPASAQVADAALQSFGQAYRDSRAKGPRNAIVGSEAIEALAATISGRALHDRGLQHLRRFTLPLGVRRALDYSWYLQDCHPTLAEIKRRQAWHLAHALAESSQDRWEPLIDHLMRLADLEYEMEAALVG